VDPIPTFVVVPKFFYPTDVERLRDPFKSFLEETTGNARNKIATESLQMNCPRPDIYRVRTGLEKMPLDALQMVGILENQEENKPISLESMAEKPVEIAIPPPPTRKAVVEFWGLVASKSDGTIYRVKVGDYLGDKDGKIINITENQIEVVELHPDGSGCWAEKNVSLALYENSKQ
jgi:type IV pilus assembly protein PilP